MASAIDDFPGVIALHTLEPPGPRRISSAHRNEFPLLPRGAAAEPSPWSVEHHGALLLIMVRDRTTAPALGGLPGCDHVGINMQGSVVRWQDMAEMSPETRPRTGATLLLPRLLVEPHLAWMPPGHGDAFPISTPATDFIAQLIAWLPHASAGTLRAVTGNVLGCFAYLLGERARRCAPEQPGGVSSRIITYIGANLGDPDLNSSGICTALGMSRSTLYRHFGMGDGVAQFIQQRRLRWAHHLIRATPPAVRLVRIAEKTGFGSPAAFWRTFKHAYGVPPGTIPRAFAFDDGYYIADNASLPVELHRLYYAGQAYLDNQALPDADGAS